jgi:hypothetical protein
MHQTHWSVEQALSEAVHGDQAFVPVLGRLSKRTTVPFPALVV